MAATQAVVPEPDAPPSDLMALAAMTDDASRIVPPVRDPLELDQEQLQALVVGLPWYQAGRQNAISIL